MRPTGPCWLSTTRKGVPVGSILNGAPVSRDREGQGGGRRGETPRVAGVPRPLPAMREREREREKKIFGGVVLTLVAGRRAIVNHP